MNSTLGSVVPLTMFFISNNTAEKETADRTRDRLIYGDFSPGSLVLLSRIITGGFNKSLAGDIEGSLNMLAQLLFYLEILLTTFKNHPASLRCAVKRTERTVIVKVEENLI